MTNTLTVPDLSVEIAGLKFKNPVLTASGTFGYGEEYAELFDPAILGGIITKGLSLKPRAGNRGIRMAETPAGMLNAIGLENVGLEAFLRDKLPYLRSLDTCVIVNIFGETEEEYIALAQALSREPGIDGLELNVSCPNVKAGGVQFGTSPEAVRKLTEKIRAVSSLPLIVKLTPAAGDIAAVARAAEQGGADAVSLINTVTGMVVDVESRRPVLGNITGGLSGPAIRPLAVYLVYKVAAAIDLPIIGIGGIVSARDALEFILAGASAVQVGTANFILPGCAREIIAGLKAYLHRHHIAQIEDLVGALNLE